MTDLYQRVSCVFSIHKAWTRETIKPHLDCVIQELHSNESLSEQEKQELETETKTSEKALKLMETVDKRIQQDPRYFGDFLDVLLLIKKDSTGILNIKMEYEKALTASRRASISSSASRSSSISEQGVIEMQRDDDHDTADNNVELQLDRDDMVLMQPAVTPWISQGDDDNTPTPKLGRAYESKALVLPEKMMASIDARMNNQQAMLGRSCQDIHNYRQTADEMDRNFDEIQRLASVMVQEFAEDFVKLMKHKCADTQKALKSELDSLALQHALETQQKDVQMEDQEKASKSKELELQDTQHREKNLQRDLDRHKLEVKALKGETEKLKKQLKYKQSQLAEKEREMYKLKELVDGQKNKAEVNAFKITKYEKQLQAIVEINKELDGVIQNKTKEELQQIQQRISMKLSEVRRPYTVAGPFRQRNSTSSSSFDQL